MKRDTLIKAWAIFGVFWFIIFAILTFALQGLSLVALIVALSFYAGMILAVISAAQIIYDLIRPAGRKPEPEQRKPRRTTRQPETTDT